MPFPSDPARPPAAGRTDPVPTPAPSPAVVLFDVNETLSDMAPLARRFEELGASPRSRRRGSPALLRDGFALTAAGASAPFAVVGAEVLRTLLPADLDRSLDEAVEHVMSGFSRAAGPPRRARGPARPDRTGRRLVTLSNGSASVADGCSRGPASRQYLERLLSVEDAGCVEARRGGYAYAAHAVRRAGEAD